MIEEIIERIRNADTSTLEQFYWFLMLELEAWKEVIQISNP